MSIKKVLSACAVVAATAGLSVVPGGGSAHAESIAPDAVTSSSTSNVAAGIGLRFPIIRCIPIFGDFDTDEIIWICEVVWR